MCIVLVVGFMARSTAIYRCCCHIVTIFDLSFNLFTMFCHVRIIKSSSLLNCETIYIITWWYPHSAWFCVYVYRYKFLYGSDLFVHFNPIGIRSDSIKVLLYCQFNRIHTKNQCGCVSRRPRTTRDRSLRECSLFMQGGGGAGQIRGGGAKSFTPSQGGGGHESFEGGQGGGS